MCIYINIFIIESGILSEYFTKGVIINETTDTYKKTDVTNINVDYTAASIRYVAVLPPVKSKIIHESIRQIKSSIDNTIYIYPVLYEKFTHRNLCIKIQMVEFISSFDTKYPDPNMPYHILKNIYSTMIGPAFCNSAFTTGHFLLILIDIFLALMSFWLVYMEIYDRFFNKLVFNLYK
jgi:hypothetical protein